MLLLLLGCQARSTAEPLPQPIASHGHTARPASAAPGCERREPVTYSRSGKVDVAFAVSSDAHFGFGDVRKKHEALTHELDCLPGMPYAHAREGAVVPPLRGLLITGDLTDWGKPDQWHQFEEFYGASSKLPVFEVVGNHDRYGGPFVEQQVAKRHGGRFYRFDWDGITFLALGEAPDAEGLAYVAAQLKALPLATPLILYFHLPLAGPAAHGWWFADGEGPDKLAGLLKGRNVQAIFHGHHHSTAHYVWNGIDVFRPGAVKDGEGDVAIVHVTDDEFTLAEYNYLKPGWVSYFSKPRK
jgi:hypothetical protein